ncbi:MAG: glycogen debranching enzyme N-terminal domain-containing protein, partial [Calditrichaceae bacterium]
MDMVFDKKVLSVDDEAMNYEWMDRNQAGAYSSSTISGMNTRREHGLFVTPTVDHTEKVVLLSKLEESIFIDNRLHEISTNQFTNNIFPNGYQYLKKFSLNPFPKSVFHIEDRIVHRTLFWVANKDLMIIRYELKNQGNPIKLIIKPFLTARYNQALTDEIQGINTDSYMSHHSVRWAPRSFLPPLHAYFLTGSYSTATLWYHNFFYEKDINRFQDQQEDLLNPGFFEATLNPYESFDLFFSTEELMDGELDYEAFHRAELKRRGLGIVISRTEEDPSSNFRNHLSLSQFIYKNKKYPALSSISSSKKLREILFSMPGLYLAEEKYVEFKAHFKNILSLLNGGLLPTQYPVVSKTVSYAAADLSLLLIDLAYKYFSSSNDKTFIDNSVYETLQSIIDAYNKGTRFNIYKTSDDLIFAGDKKHNLGWQYGAKEPGTQRRYGKLLEINALWYNALCIMVEFSKRLGKNRYVSKY